MTEGTPELNFPTSSQVNAEPGSTQPPSCGNPFVLASGGAPSAPLSSQGSFSLDSDGASSSTTSVAAASIPASGNPFLLASGGAPSVPACGNPFLLASGGAPTTVPASGSPFLKGSATSSVVRPSGNPLLMGSSALSVAAKKPELAKSDESDEMNDADSLSMDVPPSVERYTFVKRPFFVCVSCCVSVCSLLFIHD